MTKNLKSSEVIDIIQKKVTLKKELKELKSSGQSKKAQMLLLKIDQLDDELHSRPLSKN
tara:strand:+ start:336 stop:512 length:177 start_codon:yes stop_codon:yes gene_type:complete